MTWPIIMDMKKTNAMLVLLTSSDPDYNFCNGVSDDNIVTDHGCKKNIHVTFITHK